MEKIVPEFISSGPYGSETTNAFETENRKPEGLEQDIGSGASGKPPTYSAGEDVQGASVKGTWYRKAWYYLKYPFQKAWEGLLWAKENAQRFFKKKAGASKPPAKKGAGVEGGSGAEAEEKTSASAVNTEAGRGDGSQTKPNTENSYKSKN